MATRPCPACKRGRIDVESLHAGVNCDTCGKTIEVDFFWSAGIPVVLAILVTFFFNQGHGTAGFLSLAMIIAFTFFYRTLMIRWLPLKHYDDS